MPYDLVIFDCDGVLVDSEPISNRVLAADISAAGWPLSTDECIRMFKGGSLATVQAQIEVRLRKSLGPAWLADHYQRVFEALGNEVRCIQGIPAVLDGLDKSSIRYCVASQGPIAKMKVMLGRTGLWNRFSGKAFSAEMVQRPKPAPDLFLHAAQSLHTPPGAAVVIEDSPSGVCAAVAAGMAVIGYSEGDGVPLRAAGAIHVVDNMADIPALLGL